MWMRGHNWEKTILVEEIGSAKAQGSGLGLGAHFSVPEVLEKGLRRAEWLKESELRRRCVGKELIYLFNYMCLYVALRRSKSTHQTLNSSCFWGMGEKLLLFEKAVRLFFN